MPSHMPSSFASAAAGQASSRDPRGSGRTEPRGSGDWARKETRTANGTLTLRRSSTNPLGTSAQPSATFEQTTIVSTSESLSQSQSYSSHAFDSTDGRYSKDKLLDIFKAQQAADNDNDVARLYVNNWDPEHSNGSTARGWGKSSDARDHNHGPEICWDQSGQVQPIGLEEMSALEKSIFAGDINSPLKPPPQNTNKEQNTPGSATNGRKSSISHGQGNATTFGVASPTTTRPGNRRRETGDSVGYSALNSPAATRFSRDEPSPFFTRKTDKDSHGDDRDDGPGQSKSALPFGGLVRSTTGGSIGNGPSSPWSATTAAATMSPMGNFGSFALPGSGGQPATPSEKRPGLGSLRGESRLAHLMPKDSSEDMSKANEASKAQEAKSWRARTRTDTDPFGDEPLQSGSAALGGGQDISPPMQQQRRAPGLDTPTRQSSGDFGLTDVPGFRDALQGHVMQTPLGRGQREPDSPTETNPYASPPDDRAQRDEADEGSVTSDALHHLRGSGLGGIAEHSSSNFGMSRGFPMGGQFDGSDRSQTSSATGSKGFPSLGSLSGLGGLGGLGGGWPTTGNPIGTPDRERSGFQGAFGNSIFGPMGDMQSPGLGGLGAFGPPSASMSNPNTIGRGSKLGSLFPAAMQAQMHNAEGSDGHGDEHRQNSAFGAIGRNAFGPPRETDSPMRTGRGVFDDLFQASDFRGQAAFSNAENSQGQTVTSSQHSSFSHAPGQLFQQPQGSSDQSSNSTQLPQSQQRTMVMPDRMRWVYLDPQGQVQGPWSGLEMHDWYKASFFTADLSVKKVEDAEFEPLGQLIRRIGNSREPFLVPQIGVPHGPPTTQAGAPFTPAAAASSSVPQAGVVQPPFAGAFPSFGTTLTAEQQNNLERRKQEEQYLMARQREFLAQQQVNMKQMQMQGALPSALHHHSSAHSLQSQPSFGSITSPIGPMPPQQIPAPVSAFFDNTIRPAPVQQPGLNMPRDFFREDEIARLSLQDRQQSFGAPMSEAQAQKPQLNPLFSQQNEAQRAQIMQQQELEVARARELQRVRELQQQQQRQNDPEGFQARLREFEQLRAQHDAEQAEQAAQESPSTFATEPIGPPQSREKSKPSPAQEVSITTTIEEKIVVKEDGTLSLTEQVQKAAAASTKPTPQPQSPWAKVNPDLPMPFPPPPQSTTPLPAPTAQRGRSNFPDALTMGSRSRSETPETMPSVPSIAPWAKEPVDTPKGPSLKEIQEAEAKKAAKLEEAAAAARRALLEQEMRAPPVADAPGLPSTSTWGTTSPAAPPPATSAWAKGTSKAATASPASGAAKKTLAEIQREEESRKQKLAAANAVAAAAVPGISTGGKRYADLASKPSAIPATVGSAWSTVGHGGKVKIPTGPAAAAPSPLNRPASSTSVPTAPAKVIRPTIVDNRSTTSGTALPGQSGTTTATMEFMKWCKNALAKGLHSNINVDEFVNDLCNFPPESGIIADAVYSNSPLMDGRRFADEFLRRKKLADKGVIEAAGSGGLSFATGSASSGSGGWSEVAKKGPAKEPEPAAGFKVVPNKKKGRK